MGVGSGGECATACDLASVAVDFVDDGAQQEGQASQASLEQYQFKARLVRRGRRGRRDRRGQTGRRGQRGRRGQSGRSEKRAARSATLSLCLRRSYARTRCAAPRSKRDRCQCGSNAEWQKTGKGQRGRGDSRGPEYLEATGNVVVYIGWV